MISAVIPAYYNEEAVITSTDILRDHVAEIMVVFDGYKPDNDVLVYLWKNRVQTLFIFPNVPWGNARARNIGAANTSQDWLLFLDADHIVKDLNCDFNHRKVYKFRRERKGKIVHPTGSLLIHRTAWQMVNGYDERFCGHYGYEDLYMIWKLKNAGYQITDSDIGIEYIQSGEVRELDRDTSHNKRLYAELTK